MSIKDLQQRTANIQARTVERDPAAEPKSAPVRMFDATARMHAAEERVTVLEAQLNEAKKAGHLQRVPLKDLHEKPGRRRVLTPLQYEELRESVRQNGILEPIKVTPRQEGGWEVVSGNNKTAICREIGLDEVEVMVLDLAVVEADIQAFYANLFQTTLTDYESYLGFMVLKSHEPDLTQTEMARRSGKSKGTVSEVMAFHDLPEEVHELLRATPQLIGRRAAAQLAGLTRQGHTTLVVKAAEAIAAGMGQAEAVAEVESAIGAGAASDSTTSEAAGEAKEPPELKANLARPPRPVAIPIKAGRANYCSIRRSSKVLRIDFSSEEEAVQIEAEFTEFLKERAEKVAQEKSKK